MPDRPPEQKPFQVVLRRLEETPTGSFRPGAGVEVTPSLRTSGLFLALPEEDLASLLLVLSFVHPNGHVQPSLPELARALGEPQFRTRARMGRLLRFRWQDAPLLVEIRRESGPHAYAPSPHILGTVEAMPDSPTAGETVPAGCRPAGREAVLAVSRAAHSRPREDVERDIALSNGWPWPFRSIGQTLEDLRQQALAPAGVPPQLPGNPPTLSQPLTQTTMTTDPNEASTSDLFQHLLLLGVSRDEAEGLMARFDAARILRQVRWLPFRKANSPSRLLIAAIEGDYEAPVALRRLPVPSEMPDEEVANQPPTELPLP